MPQHVSPSIPFALAMAALPPLAAEVAVETVVAEVATRGGNGGRNNDRNRSSGWGIQQSTIKWKQ
jgi:hypothetical protein